jgi:hypothetical protein
MDTLAQELPSEAKEAIERGDTLVGDDWTRMSERIPVDIESLAQETKALQRKRKVKSAMDLLRMVLAYSVCDWSLRMVGMWATVIGLACLSDVAVRKRLRNTQVWLERIIGAWLQQWHTELGPRPVVLRLIDATHVSQPGSRRTDWRLHADFDLGTFRISNVEVTDIKGGETLARHTVQANEVIVADRGYAHRRGLGETLAALAYVVVRINSTNLPLETQDGESFDLLRWLQAVPQSAPPCEARVWVVTPQGRFELRLIAKPLPKEVAEAARRRVRRYSRKKGYTPSQISLLAAGFVLLVTNLSVSAWATEQVLALYRLRWQVELLFKRLKSILNLDALRAKDPTLARVYLLGKLIGMLMLEDWSHALSRNLPDWFADVQRPLSPWRWTCLWADLLRQAIRGPMNLARVLAALPNLGRYLRGPPRRRRQQAAYARQWINAFTIPVRMSHVVTQHESIPALPS